MEEITVRDRRFFPLLSLDDLAALPDPVYLIDGVLPATVFGVLFGPPGAGKSFVALDMALAIASGRDWLGHETKPGKVLYIAAEGALGIKLRIAAYLTRHDITGDNIRFLAVPFDARAATSIASIVSVLAGEGFEPDLMIVDTLARVSVGADENSARDMGEVVEGFETLKRKTNATVLVIHHTRKDGGSERGSSALRGAADVMISADTGNTVKHDLQVKLECVKMKDDEPFGPFAVGFKKVRLEEGKSSLVVADKLEVSAQGSNGADAILEILRTKFAETGAKYTELNNAFAKAGNGSKSTFDRALRELKGSDLLRIEAKKGANTKYFPT